MNSIRRSKCAKSLPSFYEFVIVNHDTGACFAKYLYLFSIDYTMFPDGIIICQEYLYK